MFRDIRNMSLSTLAAFLLLALRSVLVLKIVGPTTIGVWKSVLVLFFIAEFANWDNAAKPDFCGFRYYWDSAGTGRSNLPRRRPARFSA